MPRLPRAEQKTIYSPARMPNVAGDGYTAAARGEAAIGQATQKLGQGIGQFGAGLEAAAQVNDQQDEFNAKVSLVNFTNKVQADDIRARESFTGDMDPAGWAERRMEYYRTESSKTMEGIKSPRARQQAALYFARHGGAYQQSSMQFEGRARINRLVSDTQASITGGFDAVDLQNFRSLPKEEQATRVAALEQQIKGSAAMAREMPGVSEAQRAAVWKHTSNLALKKLEALPPDIRATIAERLQKEWTAQEQEQQAAKTQQQSGPIKFEKLPLKRTVGRPRTAKISGIVMHQTEGSVTMDGNGSWSNKKGTGANYYIDKEGKVYQWAPDNVQMAHAGAGRGGKNDIRPDLTNANTIGIEIMTRPGERPNQAQIATARALGHQLMTKYGLGAKDVVGHGEVAPGHRHADEGMEAVKALREGGNAPQLVEAPTTVATGTVADGGLPFGVERRTTLYSGEDKYFKANPHVAGMAADDGKIILNPYSKNTKSEQQAVMRNEAARLYMRNNGIKPSFDLTPEQRAQFKGTEYEGNLQAMRETIAARIFSGDPSAKSATSDQKEFVAKYLDSNAGTQVAGEAIRKSPPMRAGPMSEIIEGIQQRMPAWKQQQLRAVDAMVKQAEKSAAEGYELPSETYASILQSVEATGDPALKQRMAIAVTKAQAVRGMNQMPPDQLAEFAKRARANLGTKATPQQIASVEAVESLSKNVTKEIEKDPIAFYGKAFNVTVPVLDPTRMTEQQLADRVALAHDIARHNNRPLRVLTEQEQKAFTDYALRGGKDALGMLRTIYDVAGPDTATITKEFSKHSTEVAALGWLIASKVDSKTINDLGEAMQLKRTEKFKSIAPPHEVTRGWFKQEMGTTFSERSDAAELAIRMANDLYEVRARRSGDAGGTGANPTLWREALREVIGQNKSTDGNTTYGGIASQRLGWTTAQVWVPPYIDKNKITDIMTSLKKEDFMVPGAVEAGTELVTSEEAGKPSTETSSFWGSPKESAQDKAERLKAKDPGDQTQADLIREQFNYGLPIDKHGRPVEMAKIRTSKLVAIGDGKYWLSPQDGQYLKRMAINPKTGEITTVNVVLDLNAQALRDRNEKAYRPD